MDRQQETLQVPGGWEGYAWGVLRCPHTCKRQSCTGPRAPPEHSCASGRRVALPFREKPKLQLKGQPPVCSSPRRAAQGGSKGGLDFKLVLWPLSLCLIHFPSLPGQFYFF